MHSLCSFVGALVSLGNKTGIANGVCALLGDVCNQQTLRS